MGCMALPYRSLAPVAVNVSRPHNDRFLAPLPGATNSHAVVSATGTPMQDERHLEMEYNNRLRVPEHPAIIGGWVQDAEAYRAFVGERHRTVRYGEQQRCYIDILAPERERSRAMVCFIHGGYWQGLDPSFFSHLARGLNGRGVQVAIPGYELCPNLEVRDIIAQIRAANRELARAGRPVVLCGHSAGGHLAACLLADPDPPEYAPVAPPAMAAYSISGLFDLDPLRQSSVNNALRLDEAEARRVSPLFWRPRHGVTLVAAVGETESSEYHRQSTTVAKSWGGQGARVRYEVLPTANHFTAVAPLTDPASKMVGDLAQMVEEADQRS
jgi:arylformamidase